MSSKAPSTHTRTLVCGVPLRWASCWLCFSCYCTLMLLAKGLAWWTPVSLAVWIVGHAWMWRCTRQDLYWDDKILQKIVDRLRQRKA